MDPYMYCVFRKSADRVWREIGHLYKDAVKQVQKKDAAFCTDFS